jgi:hypothetical protein
VSIVAGVAVLLTTAAIAAHAQEPLRQHLTIEDPGRLTAAEANAVYDDIADELAGMYAISREPAAERYRRWTRHNIAPYLSATHGNRYVNNYANRMAQDYATVATQGGALPAGSIIAKDSFTVTHDKEVFGAALFLMEKLAPGTSSETADWRYVMILPDGSFIGDSRGMGADDVAYCHGCHRQRADTDFLYYVPKQMRRGE